MAHPHEEHHEEHHDDGHGRVLACEVLAMTPAIRKLMREQRLEEIPDLMLGGEDPQSFNQSLVSLYERGQITFEIGAAYANIPDEFRLNAQGMKRSSNAYVTEHDALTPMANIDIRTLLAVGVRHGASDIHLSVGAPSIFWVHGRLGPLGEDRYNCAPQVDAGSLQVPKINWAGRRNPLMRETPSSKVGTDAALDTRPHWAMMTTSIPSSRVPFSMVMPLGSVPVVE